MRDALVATGVVLALVPLLVSPVWDADFWYHIATGRAIVEGGGLLQDDPFSFLPLHEDKAFPDNLKGYWLSQVGLYLIYLAAGFHGVVFGRAALIAVALLLSCLLARRLGAGRLAVLVPLVPAALLMRHFTGDRPQLFSFVFVPLLLILLDMFGRSDGRSRWVWASVPALMALWANSHRGYPLGSVILVLHLAGAAVAHWTGRERRAPGYLARLGILAGSGILGSFANPNFHGTYTFMAAFQGSPLQEIIPEYATPFAAATYEFASGVYAAYLALVGLALAFSLRRGPAVPMLTAAALTVASLSAVRYVPYFLLATIPLVAPATGRLLEALRGRWGRVARTALALALVFMLLRADALDWETFAEGIDNPVHDGRLPESAVDYLVENVPEGRVFNEFAWGGYLMWRLGPTRRILIDTRTLHPEVVFDYNYYLHALDGDVPLTDRYGITVILMRGLDDSHGTMRPVLDDIVESGVWHLVYRDAKAVVFVRGPEHAALAARDGQPPEFAYSHVIERAAALMPQSPPELAAALSATIAEATQRQAALLRRTMERAHGGPGNQPLRQSLSRAFR
jgi:hypothetical protein